MNVAEVRLLKAALPGKRLAGKEQTPDIPLLQVVWNGPAQPGSLSPFEIIDDRTVAVSADFTT